MKVGRKEEPYGSFTVEFSQKFEEHLRKAAKEMALSAKHPVDALGETERLMANYEEMIASSVSLLLCVIGVAFCKPAILNYVFATLKSCLEPLTDNLQREVGIKEEQNTPNS